MNAADIIQIIIGVLSLMATIAISIVVAKVEQKREKQNHASELRQLAKEFIIDNQAEIGYLPLCIFAKARSEFSANKRQIYNQFNRCTEELQNEILRQQNIPIGLIDDSKELDHCLDLFDKQALETKLWNQSFLYEGGKYFHRSISRYREDKIEDEDPHEFEIPLLNDRVKMLSSDHKTDLALYMDRYLEFILRDRDDTKNCLEKLPQVPPFSVIDQMHDVRNCAEKIICFWIMRFIQSGCIAFWRHDLVQDRGAEWRQLSIESGLVETYEDMYYDTLLTLYITYSPISAKHIKRKICSK